MKALAKAIYNQAVTLGLVVHWGTAPADQAMPYLVLRLQPVLMPQYTTEDVFTEDRVIRFTVFAASMEAVMGYMQDIEKAFVAQDLTVETGHVLVVLKQAEDCFLDPERDPSAGEVWLGVLDMAITCQRKPGD